MTPPFADKNEWFPAPCRVARRLLIIAISAGMLLFLGTAADRSLQVAHQNDSASAWMRTMNLSAPALWSAGSPMRHPEMLHPGVDLRFSAELVAIP